MIYNKIPLRQLVMILLANIACLLATGQTASESKKLTRTFPLGRETNIEVTNKYGMVHIETWDKDSVQFQIEVTAVSKSPEDIKGILNNIDFQFINTIHYVVAKTIFVNPTKFLIKDLKSIFGKTNDVSIDYKMQIPSWASIKVENKYGDMYTSLLTGPVDIKLSYGKLKAYEFQGPLNLQIDFGGADISRFKRAKVDVSYSNLQVKNAGFVDLKGNFSNVDINQVDDITINSQYDKINIIEAGNVDLTSSFSTINISYLANSLQAEAKFGNINVYKFSPSFSKTNIRARYTDVGLTFDLDASGCDVDITHKKSRLMYPRSCNLKEELVNSKDGQYRTNGHMGLTRANAQLYIEAYYGNITLKKK